MTTEAQTAESNYEAAYHAHQTATAKYRALEIGDTEFLASRESLTIARKAHEVFIFGGTDHPRHY